MVTAPIDIQDVCIKYWKIVLYGKPGVGKSVVSATSRKYRTFIFDVDGQGIASVKAFVVRHKIDIKAKVWPISSQSDFAQAWTWLYAHRNEFDLVVFDSATEYQAIIKRAVPNSGNKFEKWGIMLDVMDLITSTFKDMPWHVIVVCHEATKLDEITNQPETRPAFQGDWKNQYARHFAVIIRYTMWFADVKQVIDGKQKMVQTIQRWFDCGPNPLIHFKDRSGILQRWEPVDIDKLLDKLVASQIGGAQSLSNAISQGAEDQPDIPGEITAIDDAEENGE